MQYKKINFQEAETYKYQLLKKEIFITGHELGRWTLVSPDNVMVARSYGNVVEIFPGYMWDGCTLVGEYYEDESTLAASLIHDVLYNVKKNPDDIKVPFNLWTADKIFKDYLVKNYKKNGNFFQKYLFPTLYMYGLWIFGTPWKFGNNKYYKLRKEA